MAPDDPMPSLFPVFIAVWAVVGVVGALFFHVNRDAARKERLHPPFVIGTGVFLGAILVATGPRDAPLLLGIPFVALITWTNLRNTWFCHRCGRTVYQTVAFRRGKCRYCWLSVTDR